MARIWIVLTTFAWLLLAPAPAHAGPRAVVELFTSQGCSSCRSADAYFGELAGRDDVLALSFHVDYWDYLGWRDTLGLPENTARQRGYAEVLGTRRIYTPQVIVNGMLDLVGSHRAGIEAALAQSSLPVPIRMAERNGTVEIEVGPRPLPGARATTIRLALFSAIVEVAIERGENAGAKVGYVNVVRELRPIGMWDGAVVKITLPRDELFGAGIDGCAVFVQEDLGKGPGAILGAARLAAR